MPVKFIGQLEWHSEISGVQVEYGGMILRCETHRTAKENFESIKQALSVLLDLDINILFGFPEGGYPCYFQESGGQIKTYRSRG